MSEACPQCAGTGKVKKLFRSKPCAACNGKGIAYDREQDQAFKSLMKLLATGPFVLARQSHDPGFEQRYRREIISRAQDALRSSPNMGWDTQAECHKAMGAAWHDLGDFELASSACTRSLELNSSQPQVQEMLGTALFKLDRYSEAISALKEALKQDRRLYDCELVLGDCYVAIDKWSAAKEHYQRFADNVPESDTSAKWDVVYGRLGVAYYDEALDSHSIFEMDKAIKYLEKYMRLSPGNPDMRELLQEAYRVKARWG